MIYIQFYRRTSENAVTVIGEATLTLNGRYSHRRMGEIAEQECKRRGYDAWRVFDGAKPISQLWFVYDDKPVFNPVWLSAHGM